MATAASLKNFANLDSGHSRRESQNSNTILIGTKTTYRETRVKEKALKKMCARKQKAGYIHICGIL